MEDVREGGGVRLVVALGRGDFDPAMARMKGPGAMMVQMVMGAFSSAKQEWMQLIGRGGDAQESILSLVSCVLCQFPRNLGRLHMS